MSEKIKIGLWVATGIVATIVVFCLVVAIGCAINGLTFGAQVCEWFNPSTTANIAFNTPIA